jgi:hypothetical protein
MLTKFAAALLATSLIAGSALAAQPSGAAGSNTGTPAAQTQSTPAPSMNKAGKTVKHAARHRSHPRKYLARGRSHGKTHVVRHAKPAKTHQARVGKSEKRS